MGAETWFDLVAPESRDGLVDLPTIPPTQVRAGADIDGFAAVYNALAVTWDDEPGYVYRPDGMGGWWLVDAATARLTDEEVMRPLVEDAMRKMRGDDDGE